MAQVEPLPLVPATMMTGQAKASASRSLTARTRSRPISICTSAWRDSSSASQAGKVVGVVDMGGNEDVGGAVVEGRLRLFPPYSLVTL